MGTFDKKGTALQIAGVVALVSVVLTVIVWSVSEKGSSREFAKNPLLGAVQSDPYSIAPGIIELQIKDGKDMAAVRLGRGSDGYTKLSFLKLDQKESDRMRAEHAFHRLNPDWQRTVSVLVDGHKVVKEVVHLHTKIRIVYQAPNYQKPLGWKADYYTNPAFSKDGRLLMFTKGLGGAVIVDTRTRKQIRALNGKIEDIGWDSGENVILFTEFINQGRAKRLDAIGTARQREHYLDEEIS